MNVPKLRFKDEDGREFPEWEEKCFQEVCKINQGLQIPISERFSEKGEGRYFYITNEFLKKESEIQYFIENPPSSVICTESDVLMTRTGNTGKVVTGVYGAFHNNFFKINFDKKILNRIFLCEFLSREQTQFLILKLAGTSTIPDLNHSDFYKITIQYPTLPEQTKIANFLTAVDEKISQLTQKYDLLKQYKKGVMQQIFSQKLRFKDDDGREFPGWEELNFDDGFYLANNKKAQVKSSDYSEAGHTPVIDQGQKTIVGYTNNKYVYDDVPVIIFGDHTRILKWIDFKFAPGADGTQVIKTTKRLILKFGYYYLCHIELPNLGYSRHMKEMKKQCSFAPASLKEQTKIANFLTAIDDKITQAQTQLEAVKQYKKGLLQQLFV